MNEQQQEVIERMGRFSESEGMPRIAGRLFGYLLLEREARSLDELVEGLGVSKTSVSSNARLLEQAGLLERVTHPGDRKDYYKMSADQSRVLELRLAGIQEMGSILGQAEAAASDSGDREVVERIRTMRRYNEQALEMLQRLLESWRERP